MKIVISLQLVSVRAVSVNLVPIGWLQTMQLASLNQATVMNFIEELKMIPWNDNHHILNVNENSNLWRIRIYSTQVETKLLLISTALLNLQYTNLLQIKDSSLVV